MEGLKEEPLTIKEMTVCEPRRAQHMAKLRVHEKGGDKGSRG